MGQSKLTKQHEALIEEHLLKRPRESVKRDQFFELKINDEGDFYGPFEHHDLKDLVLKLPEDWTFKVKEERDESWSEFYSHPSFQRRKPQMLSNLSAKGQQEIWVLIHGQKIGPLSFEDLVEYVDDKQVLMTDLVSFDSGYSWDKLFQTKEFDRRTFSHQQLPHLPEKQVFKKSRSEVSQELHAGPQEHDKDEAIAGLAFIEKVKSKKTSLQQEQERLRSEEQELIAQNAKSLQRTKLYGAMTVFSLLIIFSLFQLKSPIKKRVAKNSAITKLRPKTKVADIKTATPIVRKKATPAPNKKRAQTFNSSRTRRPASISAVKPKPFKETSVFKERKRLRDNALKDNPDDSYDYDDGIVESDAIRKSANRETLDPEDSYFDDEERDEFDNNRKPASRADDDWLPEPKRSSVGGHSEDQEERFDEPYEGEEEEFEEELEEEDY